MIDTNTIPEHKTIHTDDFEEFQNNLIEIIANLENLNSFATKLTYVNTDIIQNINELIGIQAVIKLELIALHKSNLEIIKQNEQLNNDIFILQRSIKDLVDDIRDKL